MLNLLHFCCIMLHCACIAWLLPVGTFGGTPPSKHLSVSTSALYNKRSTDLSSSSSNLNSRERPAESMMGKGLSVCLSFIMYLNCCTYHTGLSSMQTFCLLRKWSRIDLCLSGKWSRIDLLSIRKVIQSWPFVY